VLNGFDIRLARDGAIGQGIYFAASASTSLSYVKNGDRMLLCRVLLGNTTTGHRNLRRPPQVKPGVLYDSVEGRIGDDSMFCIFDNRQCYPEFVLEYQQLPQKNTHHCHLFPTKTSYLTPFSIPSMPISHWKMAPNNNNINNNNNNNGNTYFNPSTPQTITGFGFTNNNSNNKTTNHHNHLQQHNPTVVVSGFKFQ